MEEWGLYSRFFNLDRSMEMAKKPPPRQEHPYYMHDCIQDQPEAIAKILDSQGAAAEELAGLASGARRVYLCGIGTSWHAALVGGASVQVGRVGGGAGVAFIRVCVLSTTTFGG